MNKFKSNKININEDVAQQLKNARKEKGIKLKKIAKRLKINIKYLEALENGNFNKLPPGVYKKNFLKEYATFLDLDPEEIVDLFKYENEIITNYDRKNLFIKKITNPHYLLSIPKILKTSIIIFIIFIFISYLGYYINNITSKPELIISHPTKDLITEKPTITITGKTNKEATVEINENQTLIDKNGNFSKEINLKQGLNSIIIKSKKKYSKTNQIERKILFKK